LRENKKEVAYVLRICLIQSVLRHFKELDDVQAKVINHLLILLFGFNFEAKTNPK
jgi:hypothetical protein